MPQEKRESERVPVPGEVTGEVTVFQKVAILDISQRGAQIESTFKLQLEQLHAFRLSLGAHPVVVKARIVRCQIGELRDGAIVYRTGIEFIELSPHAQLAIQEFVDAQRAARVTPAVVDAEIAEDGV